MPTEPAKPVFDPTKAKSQAVFAQPVTYYALSFDPVSGRFFAGADDYAVHVFDLTAPKKEPVARWTRHENYVSCSVLTGPVARPILVTGSYDRHLIWWDTSTGQPTRILEAHRGWVRDLVATPDGKTLVSVGDDMLVKVWDLDTGRLIRQLEGHAQRTPQGHVTALYALAITPDGKTVASGDRIGDVRVWDLETGRLLQKFQTPTLYTYDPRQRKRSIGGIRSLAFSPDGNLLAVGGIGQIDNVDGLAGPAHVEVWDWKKPQQRVVAKAQGHQGILNSLLFHPSGSWLLGAGGGSDNSFLAFWKLDPMPSDDKKEPAAIHRVKTDGHVHRCHFDAAKNLLYTAGFRKFEVWTLQG